MKEIKIVIKIPEKEDLGALKLWVKAKFFRFVFLFWREFKKAQGDIVAKKYRSFALFSLIIVLIWKTSWTATIFWTIFVAFLFYAWDSRVLAGAALLSLASCPFLLSFKKEAWAETMAIYAYYFLVMTVGLQLVELRRGERVEETEKAEIPAGIFAYPGLVSTLEQEFASPALKEIEAGKINLWQRTNLYFFVLWKNFALKSLNFIKAIKHKAEKQSLANYRKVYQELSLFIGRLHEYLSKILTAGKRRIRGLDAQTAGLVSDNLEKEFASPGLARLESENMNIESPVSAHKIIAYNVAAKSGLENQPKPTLSDFKDYLQDIKLLTKAKAGRLEIFVSDLKKLELNYLLRLKIVSKKLRTMSKILAVYLAVQLKIIGRRAETAFKEIIIQWTKDALRVTWRAMRDNLRLAGRFFASVNFRISPHSAGALAPNFLSAGFFGKIINWVKSMLKIFSMWQIWANIFAMAIGFFYIYRTLVSGDPAALILKLFMVFIFIAAINLIISANEKRIL